MPLYLPGSSPSPGYRQGAYYTSPVIAHSSTASAPSANFVYAQPLNLPGAVIDRIAIEVTVGVAGLARLGLYTNNNGVPGSLIVDAGTVDTTNVATIEATIALTTLPEWVWAVAVFNAAPTVRVGTPAASHIVGGASFGANNRGITAALTFGALPASAPTAASWSSAVGAPIVAVRKS